MGFKNSLLSLLVIGILAGTMVPAQALSNEGARKWGWGNRPRQEQGPRPEGFFRKLDLTAEQKTKMLEQRQAMDKEDLALRHKDETLRLKMEEEMKKDNPDRKTLENIIKELGQNRQQMELKRLDFMLKFREMLTPEQKQKLKNTFPHRP